MRLTSAYCKLATALLIIATPLAASAQKVNLTTSLGEVVIELDAAKAPNSVANFLAYVNKGHYNGTIFHRVIDGFMIQGGGVAVPYKNTVPFMFSLTLSMGCLLVLR
eukprot:gene47-66_t